MVHSGAGQEKSCKQNKDELLATLEERVNEVKTKALVTSLRETLKAIEGVNESVEAKANRESINTEDAQQLQYSVNQNIEDKLRVATTEVQSPQEQLRCLKRDEAKQ